MPLTSIFRLLLLVLFVPGLAFASGKQRIVVMTDIGGDPDDIQSMVRFLVYACDFDVEGLVTGLGWGHDHTTRPDLIRECIEAYRPVYPNLKKHRSDYPAPDDLLALIKDGRSTDKHKVGPGLDSEASDWIIHVVDKPDPRPVWFTVWGGPRELAQAIWKVSHTRSPEAAAAFKKKIRVHSIADQDKTAGWVKKHHPEVFWIYSDDIFRGIYKDGDRDLVSGSWLKEHVRMNHGRLGDIYPPRAAGTKGLKEGDTPSFFYLLPDGLGHPEHPEWGNWGGRFKRSGRGMEYRPDADRRNGKPDLMYTIHRWREAFQNEFKARMDWCVKPFDEANHKPVGPKDQQQVLKADPGARVKLSTKGWTDPDGDALSFRFWVYEEAGSYRPAPPLEEDTLLIPEDASGQSIHVILEVTDAGAPPLTSYQRYIINVSGDPVAAPGEPAPVTRLKGPGAGWTFYRGVNINGRPLTLDGNAWEGDEAPHFSCPEKPHANTSVTLTPPTNPDRQTMIQAFRWNRGKARISMSNLVKDTYAAYVYNWEETNPATFNVHLNGKTVASKVNSGSRGAWQRLGPWIFEPVEGRVELVFEGGDINLSGIEVWKK